MSEKANSDNDRQDDGAPGWDAIDVALGTIYGNQTPKHYGTAIGRRFDGTDSLDGISAYWHDGAHPHWHFVTYGFSELYTKEWEDSEVSGYGFELTFRLTDPEGSSEPPMWALNFLQNLARYVFSSGNVFEPGHYMNLNGPIALDDETRICSIAFVHDPELAPIDTPHGHLEFLQVIGITEDEEHALKRWTAPKALGVFESRLPLFITDLHRTSLLEDSQIAKALREGAARDGSDTEILFAAQLSWTLRKRLFRKPQIVIRMGARQVNELTALLPFRLPFDMPFTLVGHETQLTFLLGAANSVGPSEDGLTLALTLDEATCRELSDILRPTAGEYVLRGFEGLTFEIHKTEIRNPEGQVVRVIG